MSSLMARPPLEFLSLLFFHAGVLMLIPVVERSIEGMHARMKTGLLKGRNKNAVSLSLVK